MSALILSLLVLTGGAMIAWRSRPGAAYVTLIMLPSFGFHLYPLGLETTVLELLVLGILTMWLIRFRGWHDIARLPGNFRWSVGLLLLAAAITIVYAPDHWLAFRMWRTFYLEPALFGAMIATNFQGVAAARRLLAALTIPALVAALGAIAQHWNLMPIPPIYRAAHRSTSFYSYANAVGLFLGPIIAASLVALLQTWRSTQKIRWLFVAAIALGVPAVIFSQTEAVWLAGAVTLVFFGWTSDRWRAATFAALTIGLLLLALQAPLAKTVISKIVLHDFSGAVRQTTWHETGRFLQDHWLLGAGLGGYQAAMVPYHRQTKIEIFLYPHTLIFNFWVDLGLFGLLAILYLGGTIWFYSRHLHYRALVTAPLLIMLIHGLFDVTFLKNDLAMMTFTLLALLICLKTNPPANQSIMLS